MEHDLFGKPVSTFPDHALRRDPPNDHEWLRARGAGGEDGETYWVLALQKPPFPLKAAWHCCKVVNPQF